MTHKHKKFKKLEKDLNSVKELEDYLNNISLKEVKEFAKFYKTPLYEMSVDSEFTKKEFVEDIVTVWFGD